ncbi:MAG TPA: Uma2 family endonuclease [Chthonomonadaceae bacterium]|nr:Uma2 family endonuclease [Chthonomonadaceae bacterium]
MAKTRKHRKEMTYCLDALELYLADRPDVWISGNDFLYYEKGNPKKVVSPNCYVVFGVERRNRDSYKVWEEGGKLPSVVFEFTSRKTRREDTTKKVPLYEQVLRVPEYFQFDPTGDYLKPRLQGRRLVGDRYVTLELVEGRLHSEQLGLDLVMEGEQLRFYDPRRGVWLLSHEEHAQRAQAAEAEIARLRAELDALRHQCG